MIEGELLINSDEHPGTTLHEKQFILQAIGSKYEILALTDVSYILFWFNELPLLCENRYREIIDQAEGADLHPNGDEPAPVLSHQRRSRIP